MARQVFAEVDSHIPIVFPDNRAGKDGPMRRGGPLHALWQLGCATGKHTFHGFRSMASTLLDKLGYTIDWIGRQLEVYCKNGHNFMLFKDIFPCQYFLANAAGKR